MELTFGIVFLVLLIGSTVYAIGRTIYERWIKPPLVIEESPAVIPFHTAVRLADTLARDRVLREADTAVIVLPRTADGSILPPEKGNPGVRTVDMKDRPTTGRRRKELPPVGSLPMGVAKVASTGAAA